MHVRFQYHLAKYGARRIGIVLFSMRRILSKPPEEYQRRDLKIKKEKVEHFQEEKFLLLNSNCRDL